MFAAATASSRSTAARLRAAFPDAVAAAGFLALWLAPGLFGAQAVGGAILVMGVEFVLVHATAFLGNIVTGPGSKLLKVVALAVFGSFYATFIVAFAVTAGSLWPVAAFGWLIFGKLQTIFGGGGSGSERGGPIVVWALSALFYVIFAVVTVFLPLPRLGLDPQTVTDLALPGGGLWIEEPHRVMAFGLLYFGALAAMNWIGPPALPRR